MVEIFIVSRDLYTKNGVCFTAITMSKRFDTPEKLRKHAEQQARWLAANPDQVQKKRDRAKRRYEAKKAALLVEKQRRLKGEKHPTEKEGKLAHETA